jgi:hypothetical protein
MRLDNIKKNLVSFFKKLRKYRYLIIGALIVGLFTYTVGIINSELSPERDQSAYEEARSQIEKVEFDQEAVKTIVRLRELNVDVDTIFAPGRTNPFE